MALWVEKPILCHHLHQVLPIYHVKIGWPTFCFTFLKDNKLISKRYFIFNIRSKILGYTGHVVSNLVRKLFVGAFRFLDLYSLCLRLYCRYGYFVPFLFVASFFVASIAILWHFYPFQAFVVNSGNSSIF